jgi:hypothetical protein
MLITKLLFEMKHGLNTEEVENELRKRFKNIIEDERLLTFSISVLERIVNLEGIESSVIFKFLIKCLDKYGTAGSILFRCFDISQLSFEELLILENRRDFSWLFVSEYLNRSLFFVVGEMNRLLHKFKRQTLRVTLEHDAHISILVSEIKQQERVRAFEIERMKEEHASYISHLITENKCQETILRNHMDEVIKEHAEHLSQFVEERKRGRHLSFY